MEMTEKEIVKSYQEAKSKQKQISILSQLNACNKADIEDILSKNGIEPEKRKKPVPAQVVKPSVDILDEPIVQSMKIQIPKRVSNILIGRMEELEEQIEELTSEYKEIISFLGLEISR